MSLVIEALGSVGTLHKGTVDEMLRNVRKTFDEFHAEICQTIDERHSQFLLSSLDNAEDVNQKIQNITEELDAVSKKINAQLEVGKHMPPLKIEQTRDELKILHENLNALAGLSELSDWMEKIEDSSADILYRAKVCQLAEKKVQNFIRLNAKIRLNRSDTKNQSSNVSIDVRSFHGLKCELLVQKERLLYRMNAEWSEIFQCEKSLEKFTDRNQLKVKLKKFADRDHLSRLASAMKISGALDQKVKTLAAFFLANLLEPIVENCALLELADFGDKFMQISAVEKKTETTDRQSDQILVDLKILFQKLAEIFDIQLADEPAVIKSEKEIFDQSPRFPATSAKNQSAEKSPNFKSILGHHLTEPFLELLVRKILKPKLSECGSKSFFDEHISGDSDCTRTSFDYLLANCQTLHDMLKHGGFMEEMAGKSSKSLADFAADVDRLFLNARCQWILGKARAFIISPGQHDSVRVGCGKSSDLDEETELLAHLGNLLQENCENEAIKKEEKFGINFDENEKLPAIFRFPECKISRPIDELVSLLVSVLDDACCTSNPTNAAKLYEIVRNSFDLFICIYLPYHKEQWLNVPLISALFYNNCQFLAHRATMMSLEYSTPLLKSMDYSPHESCSVVTFLDFVPRLKSMADESLADFLNGRKCILSDCLKSTDFSSLNDDNVLMNCRKSMKQCLLQIQSIHRIWQETMVPILTYKCQAVLCKFLLSTLTDKILSMEDITSNDANFTKESFSELLQELEKLFQHEKTNFMPRFCEPEYYKFKEVIFLLSANLLDIEDRWSSGQGPLTLWFSAEDVKRLLRALFQNTEKRAKLLAKIK